MRLNIRWIKSNSMLETFCTLEANNYYYYLTELERDGIRYTLTGIRTQVSEYRTRCFNR